MEQQSIKQGSEESGICIPIGKNIRAIRKDRGIGQTELASMIQLKGVRMTREMLVKIERGTHNVTAVQLRIIRDLLNTTYDELLRTESEN